MIRENVHTAVYDIYLRYVMYVHTCICVTDFPSSPQNRRTYARIKRTHALYPRKYVYDERTTLTIDTTTGTVSNTST